VLHGSDWDIMWLQRDFGIYVANLFDTGQACRVLQHPRFGLAHMLTRLCGVQVPSHPCPQPCEPCNCLSGVDCLQDLAMLLEGLSPPVLSQHDSCVTKQSEPAWEGKAWAGEL